MSGVDDRGAPGAPREPRLEDFPSLVTYGERLVVARPRRLRRRLGSGGLAVVVAFVGTTGLALTAATGSPVPPFLRADGDSAVLRPEPASTRVSDVRAVDPTGGAPWTVRRGTAADGTTCVSVGQVRDGRLGLTTRTGSFERLPDDADSQCGAGEGEGTGAPAIPVVGLRDVGGLTGRRVRATVLFGVASAGTDRVRALMPNGRQVRADVAPDGSFVAMLPGEPRQAQPIVTAERGSGGVQVPFQLPRTLPDPAAGGTPWTLVSDNAAQRDAGGSAVDRPGLTCHRLFPANGFRISDRTPAVCEVRPGVGATVTPLRRGASGRFDVGALPQRVSWRGLPDRTLVTARVRGDRAIVTLRARGRAWAVRRVGTVATGRRTSDGVYFGLLPGLVRGDEVRVTAQSGAAPAADVPVREVDLRTDGGERP